MFDSTELIESTAKAAGVDEHLLTDQELLDGALAFETALQSLQAGQGAFLAELDARGTTDIVSGHRTATWLATKTGIAPAEAKRRVRLASMLRTELPETDRAVREGRLCADRARVMAGAINDRIAPEFRQMETSLIAESARMAFGDWAQRVQLVAALLDQDGPEPAEDVANNRLSLKGSGADRKISGRLVGDAAVTASAAIEQIADELWRQYRDDSERTNGEIPIPIPSRSTLRALAFVELCRRGLMVDHNGAAPKRPKVEATFVINADTPDVVYLDGKPLIRGSATALACDMEVWTIIMNSLGVPLDMGRDIRTANDEQRKALKCRDGGCVFPGCGMRPEHCDAHHVAQWHRDLGTTDIKYMAYLCRHHHGVIHRRGWNIQIGDDGWCWITTPSGISMWCQQHGTIRSGAPPGG